MYYFGNFDIIEIKVERAVN